MEEGGIVLMDLLWSDPTTNDGVEGVQPSPRGPGLVTFGPDRVKEFCKARPPTRRSADYVRLYTRVVTIWIAAQYNCTVRQDARFYGTYGV